MGRGAHTGLHVQVWLWEERGRSRCPCFWTLAQQDSASHSWWVLHVSSEASARVPLLPQAASPALLCGPSSSCCPWAPWFSAWGPGFCLWLLPGEEEELELAAGVLCPGV